MSFFEAKEDGVPTIQRPGYGIPTYYPPCRLCGQPVKSANYIRGKRYLCTVCRQEMDALEKSEKEFAAGVQKERKLERAIKRIAKVTDIHRYNAAIDYVRKNLYLAGWFQSTEEIMTAMELYRRGVKFHHQVKVFDYYVDFVLDDMKVLLEIDGSIYHGKERAGKEERRDNVLQWRFGSEWQVIHISTDCINMNVTKLMAGIRAVLKKRKVCT